MSSAFFQTLSLRDKKMLIAVYETRDLDLAASTVTMEKNTLVKRLALIQRQAGQIFDIKRGKVSLLPHTTEFIGFLEYSVRSAEAAESLLDTGINRRSRARVDICVIDHFVNFIVDLIEDKLMPSGTLQPQIHQASSGIGEDRFQNLGLLSRRLEAGEIDIVIYYEFDKSGVLGVTSHFPTFHGLQLEDIYRDKNICVVNAEADVSSPMTYEEHSKLLRVGQVPAYLDDGQDMSWILTTLDSAIRLINKNPQYMCTPPLLAADLLPSELKRNIKLVEPPSNFHLPLAIKMAWANTTENHAPCDLIRETIRTAFKDLKK